MKKNFRLLPVLFLSISALMMTGCGGPAPVEEDPDQYVDVLPDNNNGNILQAFCWSFNQIKNSLPAIANSGFKVVQTSPVQEAKNNGPNWYSFYQPVAFTIARKSPLGTKEELKELCEEADKYGIRIICDIVFNHLANIADGELEADGTPKVFPAVANYEPYIYEHRNDVNNPTFHHNKNARGSGAITQYYSYGDLPDLNTANEKVQERSLALLKECIDVGVDGFRFDAAKHIETPDDPDYASNFWPNVLGEAKTYYKAKTNEDLIAYGEILNDVDGGRTIDMYTKHMKVTDNGFISRIAAASVNGKAEVVLEAQMRDSNHANLVNWVESHDTYVESKTHVSDKKTARQYAIITARKDVVSMYLARPDSAATVGKIASYFFEDELVGCANRFHNRFHDYEDELTAEGSIFINEKYKADERANPGALLVSLQGKTEEKEVTLTHLGTGIYYDQLSGNSITVRNGKAKVTFDDNGLIFLTKTKNQPRPTISIDNRDMTFAGSLDVNITVNNATSSWYSINGGEHVSFTNKVKVTLSNQTDEKNAIALEIGASNSQFSISRKSSYSKVSLIPGYINIVNINPNYFEQYEFYIWAWGGNNNGTWMKNYQIRDGVLLVDFSNSTFTGFLLAAFEKGYTITKVNDWDNHVIKQTGDISVNAEFYDASTF